MIYKMCFVLVAILGFVGCADELGSSKEGAGVPQIQSKALSPNFEVTVEGADVPFEYSVLIEWQEFTGTVRISEGSKILAVLPSSEKSFLHQKVPHDSQQSYLLEQLSADGRVLASIPLFVAVPKDVVLDGEIKLKESQNIEANRIFLKSRLVLYTLDRDLHLSANVIIGENGLIQNYPKDQASSRGAKGRSGGNIIIQAKESRGSLRIALIGERGGDGKDGVITVPGRHPGCVGTNGGQGGKAGSLSAEITENSGMNITYENIQAPGGGAGRRGVATGNEPPDQIVHAPCHRDSAPAVAGSVGEKGRVCLKLYPATKFLCGE